MEHLLRGLPMSAFHTLHVWSDCGTHFRGYHWLWKLGELVVSHELKAAIQHYYAEHHGKGRNDGQFGLQRKWTDTAAAENMITTLTDYQVACVNGARATMEDDPPPAGPAYVITTFYVAKPKTAWAIDQVAPSTTKSKHQKTNKEKQNKYNKTKKTSKPNKNKSTRMHKNCWWNTPTASCLKGHRMQLQGLK